MTTNECEWQEYEAWHTLWIGEHRMARLYSVRYLPRWTTRLLNQTGIIKLDPALTWEEAKLVVQTLAGAQL